MSKKSEDPEMNPQTKGKGRDAQPAPATSKANKERGDAIERNVTGKTGTPKGC